MLTEVMLRQDRIFVAYIIFTKAGQDLISLSIVLPAPIVVTPIQSIKIGKTTDRRVAVLKQSVFSAVTVDVTLSNGDVDLVLAHAKLLSKLGQKRVCIQIAGRAEALGDKMGLPLLIEHIAHVGLKRGDEGPSCVVVLVLIDPGELAVVRAEAGAGVADGVVCGLREGVRVVEVGLLGERGEVGGEADGEVDLV